jgi:ER membrane protein complex subunit 4
MDTLKMKKAWEIAIAPAKSLPMNAIGMYMSGNSLQIFSIMMVLMLFKTPITALLNLNGSFARFETEGTKQQLIGVKIVYVLTNFLAMGLGIWKIDKMGLLPYVSFNRASHRTSTNLWAERHDQTGWLGRHRGSLSRRHISLQVHRYFRVI